ncbi:hypothetical protein P154DRAFT_574437 [Amniculicola lignicola CBS 123094]|uniref:RING-type domain-containing protein n=1 Tax=Amniculicola lignicola CBS 123094 TaxID=1392246 RepID=A0A6A5WML3_9PLEO|nr:hypothetical protein P154DRAFT_574437 [Amniculicola lignicola CBS 123094]
MESPAAESSQDLEIVLQNISWELPSDHFILTPTICSICKGETVMENDLIGSEAGTLDNLSGHPYHRQCLSAWLRCLSTRRNLICPLDRRVLLPTCSDNVGLEFGREPEELRALIEGVPSASPYPTSDGERFWGRQYSHSGEYGSGPSFTGCDNLSTS